MNKRMTILMVLIVLAVACPGARAQAPAQTAQTSKPKAQPGQTATAVQKQNVQAYIELMRTNVRQQKAQIMGIMMQLNAEDADKFWGIYTDYDTELTKVNNLRIANIKDYSQNYNQMTDAKADQLIQTAFEFRKQRSELLAKTYERMKQSLGALTAARFLQVEDQLLLLIDLQIDANLPIVGE